MEELKKRIDTLEKRLKKVSKEAAADGKPKKPKKKMALDVAASSFLLTRLKTILSSPVPCTEWVNPKLF